MKVLRTPEERFNHLVDFPFPANYLDIDDEDGGNLRMHYIDEGVLRWRACTLYAWPTKLELLL